MVIGNGAEGEPLSHKDATLLSRAPHLVLDGLQAAADAVNAHKVYLYLHQNAVLAAEKALDERRAAGIDRHAVTVITAPDTFVAGEGVRGDPPRRGRAGAAARPHRGQRGLRGCTAGPRW